MIAKMIAGRLVFGLVVLFTVSLIIFAAVELLPGNIAEEILGQTATPETVAALERQLGLDQPPLRRYVLWLGDMLKGDFGQSLANGRPVSELINSRFGDTLFLAGFAAVLAVPIALVLGILTALKRNSIFDRSSSVLSLFAVSMPEFFIAYLVVATFALQLGWFSPISNISENMAFSERLAKSFLPALTLNFVVIAHMMRMTRASILNVMASPYIEMAELKGLRRRRVITHHALPNALAPIINVIVVNLAYLVVGVVVVEVVFVYPGLGQLMVDSVSKRDITVVQACCLVFAATYVLLNLIADVLSTLSNPRMLHPK